MSDQITAQQFMASLSCNSGTREPLPSNVRHVELCGEAAELADARRQLKNIREQIVEHVMDGDDYDFVAAIVYIRAWREELAETKRQLASADKTLAGFTTAVREARETLVQIRDIAEDDCGSMHSAKILRLCESWLNPPLVGAARVVAKEQT